MTTSQIKAGLNEVAELIRQQHQRLAQADQLIQTAITELGAVPTRYGALVTAIQGLSGTDPFVLLTKDELTKLTAEFQALKATAESRKTAIDGTK